MTQRQRFIPRLRAGVTAFWLPRVGASAAPVMGEAVVIMLVSAWFLLFGGALAVGGTIGRAPAVWVPGVVLMVIFGAYMIRLNLVLARFNRLAGAALGVRVRWPGPPTKDWAWQRWAEGHGVSPHAFDDRGEPLPPARVE